VVNLDGSPVRVKLVHWPAQAARRDELAADGHPRLLLVGEGVEPPDLEDGEDWIRVPADEHDLWTRVQRLAILGARRLPPELVDGVVLRYGGATVLLTDADGQLAGPLVERFAHLVPREELERRIWPGGPPGPRSLESRLHRLRQATIELGLTVHTVRGRGFVLDHGDDPGHQP
jgi:two-component system OmpR family response regulator